MSTPGTSDFDKQLKDAQKKHAFGRNILEKNPLLAAKFFKSAIEIIDSLLPNCNSEEKADERDFLKGFRFDCYLISAETSYFEFLLNPQKNLTSDGLERLNVSVSSLNQLLAPSSDERNIQEEIRIFLAYINLGLLNFILHLHQPKAACNYLQLALGYCEKGVKQLNKAVEIIDKRRTTKTESAAEFKEFTDGFDERIYCEGSKFAKLQEPFVIANQRAAAGNLLEFAIKFFKNIYSKNTEHYLKLADFHLGLSGTHEKTALILEALQEAAVFFEKVSERDSKTEEKLNHCRENIRVLKIAIRNPSLRLLNTKPLLIPVTCQKLPDPATGLLDAVNAENKEAAEKLLLSQKFKNEVIQRALQVAFQKNNPVILAIILIHSTISNEDIIKELSQPNVSKELNIFLLCFNHMIKMKEPILRVNAAKHLCDIFCQLNPVFNEKNNAVEFKLEGNSTKTTILLQNLPQVFKQTLKEGVKKVTARFIPTLIGYSQEDIQKVSAKQKVEKETQAAKMQEAKESAEAKEKFAKAAEIAALTNNVLEIRNQIQSSLFSIEEKLKNANKLFLEITFTNTQLTSLQDKINNIFVRFQAIQESCPKKLKKEKLVQVFSRFQNSQNDLMQLADDVDKILHKLNLMHSSQQSSEAVEHKEIKQVLPELTIQENLGSPEDQIAYYSPQRLNILRNNLVTLYFAFFKKIKAFLDKESCYEKLEPVLKFAMDLCLDLNPNEEKPNNIYGQILQLTQQFKQLTANNTKMTKGKTSKLKSYLAGYEKTLESLINLKDELENHEKNFEKLLEMTTPNENPRHLMS